MNDTLRNRFHSRYSLALMAIIALSALSLPLSQSQAAKSTLLREDVVVKKDDTVNVAIGKGEVIKVEGAITDIMVGNATIANVEILQSNSLYILGRSIGDTNIIALDAAGNVVKRINIHVHFNTEKMEETIYSFYPNETDVKVQSIGSRFIITGRVPNPSVARRIEHIVAAHAADARQKEGTANELIVNMLDIMGEQQVMLNVKIVEVNRSILKELGLETSINGTNATAAQRFNVLPPPSVASSGYLQNLVNSATGLTEDPFTRAALD